MGRWLDQTVFPSVGDSPSVVTGNCVQACVASILHVPLEEVPSFLGMESFDFWESLDAYLLSKGFQLRELFANSVMQGLYLASGRTERETSHMVVMRDGKLKHDPHPTKKGLQTIEHVWVLVPLDPAECNKV